MPLQEAAEAGPKRGQRCRWGNEMAKRKAIKTYERNRDPALSPEPLKIFISTVPFLAGVYYEWASGIVCMFLLAYLWYCRRRTGRILIFRSEILLAAAVLAAAYGISILWAVDPGAAAFGFVKFLPLPVFVLALGQLEKEQRTGLLDMVPLSGAVMTAVSRGLGQIPLLNSYLIVNHRLAGFFQYPNTFALYLLVGIIVLLSKEKWQKRSVCLLLILFLGIGLTGSRTGFILTAATLICYAVWIKDRRVRTGLCGLLICSVAAVGIYVLVTGNVSSVGRYFTTSLSSSTFVGRLLYFKDAIPVILKHPLGLGYMGYYFTQGRFQTGVYTVRNIHNELLQLLLDIGWLPAGILIWAVITGIRRGNRQNRMIILVIALHSALDFNLQFLVIFFLLLAAIDLNEKSRKEFTKKKAFAAGSVIAGCVSLYFGAASILDYLKLYPAAVQIYPGNTNAWMELLKAAEDVEEMEQTADRILEINPENPLANNAKARAAYSRGDFGNMIRYKEEALEYYKYNLAEYLDYFDMLYVGYQLYIENHDLPSAEICAECMRGIPETLAEVSEATDPLAYQINDKPQLDLPETYEEILRQIGTD